MKGERYGEPHTMSITPYTGSLHLHECWRIFRACKRHTCTSLHALEEPRHMILLCYLWTRHLDRLSNLGDMPTEVFLDLLKRAKGKATPEVVQRLQDQNEASSSP